MESHDDPEARIRELERSSADRGRAAELGITPPDADFPPPPQMYGPPPPMPPPVDFDAPYPPPVDFDTPYPPPVGFDTPHPPPRRRRTGVRVSWLIVAAVLVVGAVTFAEAITSVGTMFSVVRSFFQSPGESPTVAGNGAPSIDMPAIPTRRPGIPAPPTAASPSVVPPGGQLSVSGVGENRTIDCNGGAVSVSGVSNTVVITGYCVNLDVSGVDNVVSVDSAATIGVSGFDNQVTFHSGTPQVANAGGSNVVQQG